MLDLDFGIRPHVLDSLPHVLSFGRSGRRCRTLRPDLSASAGDRRSAGNRSTGGSLRVRRYAQHGRRPAQAGAARPLSTRRTLLPPAAQSPGAVKPAVPSRRTRTCRSCHAQAQVAGQTANTSRNTRARRLWSCYLSCMIFPGPGKSPAFACSSPPRTR
jgi:hypothetical protein